MNMIETINLSHCFADGTQGLHHVSLGIPEGALVVIAGANGCGKTTLLRHFNGLLTPTEGEVRIHGKPVSEDPLQARRLVGMVFQDADSQIVGETVWDDVAFGPANLRMKWADINRCVTAALETVGLYHMAGQPPHLLSGGEKRRLAIAGVLAMEPRILVFDEPFSNLDYTSTRQVLAQIVSLHDQGRTVVVTTHDLEKIIAHAQRLVLMKAGQVVRDAMPHEIMAEVETFGVRQPCASRLGRKVASWLA